MVSTIGTIDLFAVAAIASTATTYATIEVAATWLRGEFQEASGEERHLAEPVTAVRDTLGGDPKFAFDHDR